MEGREEAIFSSVFPLYGPSRLSSTSLHPSPSQLVSNVFPPGHYLPPPEPPFLSPPILLTSCQPSHSFLQAILFSFPPPYFFPCPLLPTPLSTYFPSVFPRVKANYWNARQRGRVGEGERKGAFRPSNQPLFFELHRLLSPGLPPSPFSSKKEILHPPLFSLSG